MKKFLILFLAVSLHAEGNRYYSEITPADKENLTYVVETLSSHGTLGLYGYKDELQKRGGATGHLHVLQSLGFIFSDPKLATATKNIEKVPWRRFARDYGKSLAKADKQGELTPEVIEDFSRRVGADPKVIGTYVQNKNWAGLMNFLRDR